MKPPFQIFSADHVRLIVGNAKQAAHYYQTVFGFEPVAYRGLETGDREKASYMLQQNKIRLVLSSPYRANSPMNVHLMLHGDGVRDVAFWVDDATAAWEYTTQNGAVSHQKPTEYSDDNGKVVLSSIHTYGDTLHTFVERKDYDGVFLPGFMPYKTAVKTSDVGLNFIDHFVGNQPEGEMQKVARGMKMCWAFTASGRWMTKIFPLSTPRCARLSFRAKMSGSKCPSIARRKE